MPVGVQCPISSSLGEFPSYWDWLWCPGLSPVLVSIAFPSPFILYVFLSLFLPLDFNRVSSFRPTYRHPFGRPFPYSLFRWVSRLGTGSGTRCCGPRGGTAVRMEQITLSKFLPYVLSPVSSLINVYNS